MPYLVLGWDGWIRTSECGSQSPMPCRLATPQYNAAGAAWCWRWDSNPHGFPCDFESQLSASSSTPTYPPTISITILCILLSKSLVSILGRKTSETSPEQISFSLFLYYHNYAYLSIAFLGFCESFFRTHKSASTPNWSPTGKHCAPLLVRSLRLPNQADRNTTQTPFQCRLNRQFPNGAFPCRGP